MALTIKLTPGYVYTDNEVDTAAKRNLAANPTIDLEGTVSTLAIADGSVTTPKLVDGVLSADAAGRAKMADGFLSADATGRGKMGDGYLTAVKAEETFREGVAQYSVGVFTAGTYAIALNPAATAYTAGMRVVFQADTTNTGVTSLNVNGLGAKTLKTHDTSDLGPGRVLAGQIIEAIYDGTNFQLVNEPNKFDLGETTIGVGLAVDTAHSLVRTPGVVRFALRCKTAEFGYAVGDEVALPAAAFTGGANATNVFVICNSTATISVWRKDTFAICNLTAASWKIVGYARL
jgi:hypothetical protein